MSVRNSVAAFAVFLVACASDPPSGDPSFTVAFPSVVPPKSEAPVSAPKPVPEPSSKPAPEEVKFKTKAKAKAKVGLGGAGGKVLFPTVAGVSVPSTEHLDKQFEKDSQSPTYSYFGGASSPPLPAAALAPEKPNYGSAAYYVANKMVESRASFVDLWIDRTAIVGDLTAELAKHLQLTADRIKTRIRSAGKAGSTTATEVKGLGDIKIGDSMVAQLRGGNDFSIEPKEPITQSLKATNRVKWNWRVTPTRSSDEGMPLVLEVLINPGPDQHIIESIREVVIVQARPQTILEHLQGVEKLLNVLGLGGIGVIALGVWRWLKKRRKRKGAGPPVVVPPGNAGATAGNK